VNKQNRKYSSSSIFKRPREIPCFLKNKIDYFTAKRKGKFDEWKNRQTLESHKEKFSVTALNRKEFPDQKVAKASKPKPPKRPTMDFSEVSNRQKRRKLTDLNSELDDFARDNNIDVNQGIGYLLYQRNYNTKKYLAKLGDPLYREGDLEESARVKLDVDHALALKHHINLSRNDLDFLKNFLKDFIHIPNRNIIREHSKELVPKVVECREKRGIMVANLQETVTLTICRLLE
jgi:AAA15 family ATPase/GTPase